MTGRIGYAIAILGLAGCTALEPGDVRRERDAGGQEDSGVLCAEADSGTPCGDDFICIGIACIRRGCGNGFLEVELGEECDDGNLTTGDGCERDTCTFTCGSDADCDDGDSCDGEDSCTTSHICVDGTLEANGSACVRPDGSDGACHGAVCAPLKCGDGNLDSDEHCDDGNATRGDGCEPDCRFTCEVNTAVPDNTWYADCDRDSYARVGATMQTSCVTPPLPGSGCGWTLRVPSVQRSDCDDAAVDVHPDATETCNGIDDDCDATVDDGVATTYYPDDDHDDYGRPGTTMSACSDPGPDWAPNNTDCCDADARSHPGATTFQTTPRTGGCMPAFDFDCSGSVTREVTRCGVDLCGSVPIAMCVAQAGYWLSSICAVPSCGTEAEYVDGCILVTDPGGTFRCRPQGCTEPPCLRRQACF